MKGMFILMEFIILENNELALTLEGEEEGTPVDGANAGTEGTVDTANDTSSEAAQPNSMAGMIQMIAMVAVFGLVMYFFIFRPQKSKQKKEEAMRSNIQIGDEIITIGGIYGRIVSLKEDSFVIESPDHSKQRIAKWAVQSNLTVHDD